MWQKRRARSSVQRNRVALAGHAMSKGGGRWRGDVDKRVGHPRHRRTIALKATGSLEAAHRQLDFQRVRRLRRGLKEVPDVPKMRKEGAHAKDRLVQTLAQQSGGIEGRVNG